MKFNTAFLIAMTCVSAVLVYQFTSDTRLDKPKRDMQRIASQFSAQASAHKTTDKQPDILRGAVRVVDGATLEFLNPRVTVELAGVDSCDATQSAYYNGTPWPCGAVATSWLVSQTLGQTVECEVLQQRYNGLVVGRCGVNGADVAAEALLAGQAVINDNVRTGIPLDKYRALENQAKAAGIGVWSGSFTMPNQFRRDRVKDKDTEIRHIDPDATLPKPDIRKDKKSS